jgi:TolB-like protein/Tfp pilus assembly protein PilF
VTPRRNGNLRYLFEDYTLDTERRELHRGADAVAITPQVFDLLDYLIRNRERVVSKDNLISTVWNGRIVSDAALTTRLNAARNAIGDSGEEQRLIKTLPRKGFRFVGPVRETQRPAGAAIGDSPVELPKPALTLPDKPSIAVLPFENMSGDPEQEYFADGMVEEIITGLSRSRLLFVIARNSSFTYKGKAVDIKQVGRELGVRYVVEGSVRKAGNRVRITGELIDAATGNHIWADRYESTLEDIFDLQDQFAASVLGAILPKLEQAEIERSSRKPTENFQAYDYYLQGLSCLCKISKEENEQALQLFQNAINLDPQFALAFAQAAGCYSQRKSYRWVADRTREAAQADFLARKALELTKDDPAVLTNSGFVLAFVSGQLEEGAAYLKRAIDLDPNLASSWYWSGWIQIFLGNAAAIEHFHRSIRLSPLEPRIFIAYGGLAFSFLFAGQYDEASKWAEIAVRYNPQFLGSHRIAMACHALSGRLSEAREACSRAMKMDPTQRISNIRDRQPFRRDADVARLAEGFRLAGMPE